MNPKGTAVRWGSSHTPFVEDLWLEPTFFFSMLVPAYFSKGHVLPKIEGRQKPGLVSYFRFRLSTHYLLPAVSAWHLKNFILVDKYKWVFLFAGYPLFGGPKGKLLFFLGGGDSPKTRHTNDESVSSKPT